VVELEAEVNIKGVSVYPASVRNDCFCALV